MSRIPEFHTNTHRPSSPVRYDRNAKPVLPGAVMAGFILIAAIYLFAGPASAVAQSMPDYDSGPEAETTSVVLFDTLSLTLSESYLYKVAESHVKQSRGIGAAYIGLGVAGIVYGSVLMGPSEKDDFLNLNQAVGELFVILGGASLTGGLIVVAATPSAEKQWLKYLPDYHIEADITDRARTAREALRERAEKGKTNRIVGSLLGTAAGLVILSGTDQDMTFATIGLIGVTVVGLMNKSPAEVQWENYMRETGDRSRNPVRIGIGLLPDGGGVVTARFSL